MVSLLDIGELSETVMVSGKPLSVSGISAEGVLYLLQKFPELKAMISGRAADVAPDQLMATAPAAIAAIIAAGLGQPGDERVEERARKLGIAVQLEILQAVVRMTFPDGLDPFVEKLRQMSESSRDAASKIASATTSESPPSDNLGKALGMKSPEA
jgi:hypothetical protein